MENCPRKTFREITNIFRNEFQNSVIRPAHRLLGTAPSSFGNAYNSLHKLEGEIQPGTGEHKISSDLVPWLRSVVIHERRRKALEIEQKVSNTSNREVIEALESELSKIAKFTKSDWFLAGPIASVPRLTDCLTISAAESELVRTGQLEIPEREYDEKFGILMASTLFLPDLAAHRALCEIRRRPVTVAFLDIGLFKDFNTAFGEPRVDRDVLPIFMSELEAHIYWHGYAYKFGGDEYLALMPNQSADQAVVFLSEFQERLKGVSFFEIDKRITLSIGVVEAGQDCPLTGHEILEHAAFAKNFAKENGRNRIVGFSGTGHTADEPTVLFVP